MPDNHEISLSRSDSLDLKDLKEIIFSVQNENKRLRSDNYKLAEKVRKIESGNFDEYYTYQTSQINLIANGTATTTIATTREADFYLAKLVRVSTGTFSFMVRDSSNDRQWSNVQLHSDIGAGTAQLPLILPKPRFVARSSTLTIDITDLSGAANTVRLGFIGYKVYHVEDLKNTVG